MHVLVDIAIPVVVILMMLAVGLELTPDDFRRVIRYPKAVLVATAGQLIALPAIAAGLALALDPPAHIAAGMVLVAACPGGAISNYYVYLARADVALSVTLTALATVLAFVTLPVLTALGFELLFARQTHVPVPVGSLMIQLFSLLLLPTVAGMWVRRRWSAQVRRRGGLVRRFSLGALAALVVFVILDQSQVLFERIWGLLLMALLFTLFAMVAGAATARWSGQNSARRFAFMVEYGARNLGIATVVGATLLGHTEFVVFAAAFFLIQVPVMLTAVAVQRLAGRDPALS